MKLLFYRIITHLWEGIMAQAAAKTSAAKLSEGQKAPDFNLPVEGGKTVSLSSLKGKNVVLYFYPKDDTPGCTVEANDFAKAMGDFEKANTVILGVSRDSIKSHEKFREKYCLPFSLISDEAGSMCEDYGVWVEKSMYGKTYMGIERSTFLIDTSGTIRKIWPKVKVDGHCLDVLSSAKSI